MLFLRETNFRDEDKKIISNKVLAEVDKWLERFDCLVIGPGLGRDPFLLVCSLFISFASITRFQFHYTLGNGLLIFSFLYYVIRVHFSIYLLRVSFIITPNVCTMISGLCEWNHKTCKTVKHPNCDRWGMYVEVWTPCSLINMSCCLLFRHISGWTFSCNKSSWTC